MTDTQAASERLDLLTARLADRLGREAAVSVLTGSTLNLLFAHFGRDGAARYLRLLADEIEADETPAEPPGAVQ